MHYCTNIIKDDQVWPNRTRNRSWFSHLFKSHHLIYNYFQIRRDNFICNEDISFSMTKCLQEYIASKANCYIDWFQSTEYPPCKTSDELNQVRKVWSLLREASYDTIVNKTGCIRRCSEMKYEMMSEGSFDITWNSTKWISEYYVYIWGNGVFKM